MVQELLQTLIAIPSVNPDSTPGTTQVGELRLAKWLDTYMSDLGFHCTLEEVKPGRPNLICRSPGSDLRPRIFLGPHLDTVGVAGMSIDPFGGEIRDDRIWGRGASDTKGPMAAMITALKNRAHLLSELPVAIDFVAFMAEESSQWGSKDFGSKYAKDYVLGIAGEPTSLDIVYTTKGSTWITVETSGKAAHASQPERGQNAILSLTRSLDLMNRKLAGKLATFTHPVLGHSTLNIGTIQGGTRPNIVPDFASAEIDIRYTPTLHECGGALDLTQSFIKENQLPLKISECHTNPPMEVDNAHPMLKHLLLANPTSQLVGAPWFSDAAHLNDAGCPSVCIGPGSIDQAHTKNEFIAIRDLLEGVSYFENLIDSFAS